jgi:hypothetical protein
MQIQKKPNQKRSDSYHNTERLLKTYRDVRWNLKLSMEQHRQDFEAEYGMSVTEYLEDVYAAGADFMGTKLEHHANSMKRTAEMLKLIDSAAHIIRDNNGDGETFYWLLYYTYFSPHKLNNVDEIVERIQMHIPYITRDTYYRQRKKAISILSSVLWGFTAKDDISIRDAFISETITSGGMISGQTFNQ